MGVGIDGTPWVTLPLIVLAGAGHSVFHPANYSIMSASIRPEIIGRAFSFHTFSGHLGTAVAPAAMGVLMALIGWRTSLLVLGAAGLLIAVLLLVNWNVLSDTVKTSERREKAGDDGEKMAPAGWSILLTRPMILFSLFFASAFMVSGGIQSFSITALMDLQGFPLSIASSALSFYLFASTFGILLGGVIADRTSRHNIIAALAFLATAGLFLLIGALALHVVLLYLIMAVAGVCQGLVRPARDMMVRAAAPKGASGKVFGFVSTGISAGGAISPILFGWVVDRGSPQ